MSEQNPFRSNLDQQQIFQRAFDEDTDRIRVDAELTASIIAPPGLEVAINAHDDNIAIRNSNNNNELLINPDGSINVTASGGSSDTNLIKIAGTAVSVNNGTADAGTLRVAIASNNTPFSVNAVQSGAWTVGVNNFPATQAVTQSTSPWVVSGTVTANIGTTGGLALNSTLSTINTTLGSPFQAGGSIGNTSFIATQALGTNLHVNVDNFPADADSLAQGSTTTGQLGSLIMGASTTNAPSYSTATTNPLSLDTSGLLRISLKDSPVNTNKFLVITDPITFASPQHTILDSGTLTTITNPVTVVNSGTFAVQATQSGTWNINNISGTISLPTGAATSTNQTTANTSLSSIDSKLTTTNSDLTTINTSIQSLQVAQGSTTSGELGPLVQGAVTTSAPTYISGQTDPLSLTTAGALRVDGSGTTQPVSVAGTVAVTQSTSPWVVSGTITTSPNVNVHDGSGVSISSTGSSLNVDVTNTVPVSQSGSWAVTANIGTTGGLALDSSLTTINTSIGGLLTNTQLRASPVPVSGTITANAGTGNFTVVQPTGTNLHVTVDNFPADADALAQGSTTSGQLGALIMGAVTTNAPSYTTAQTDPLSLDTSGLLRVSLKDTPANTNKFLVTADPITFASPQHTIVDSGTITANQGTSPWVSNITQFGSSNVVTGTGASGAGIPRVTVSNDSNILATQSGTWTTGRTWTLSSGTDSVAAVQSGTWTVQPGNTANTTPWLVTDSSDGPVTPGTVAGKSSLAGGQFNTVLPTLTNTQQAALQVDSSGRLIISPTSSSSVVTVSNLPTTVDTNYGTVGASTIRTASQLGNSTGAALFGAGTTTAQVLRVVLPTDQTAIPVTQSGAWTVTANAGTNLNTSALALDATLTQLTLSQGSTTSGEKGPLIQGAVTTAAPSYTTAQTSPLSLDTSGNLRTVLSTSSAVIGHVITDSGSVTSASQSGTWTVQPGNTANTTPWLFTINQGGNSATVTGANALKVDGSGVTQPVSGTVTANIGTTNGLALDTSVNGLLVSQSSTTSGEKGPLIQGAVTTAAPTYTTAQTNPLSLTTAGALRVDGSGSTQPISGTVTANAGTGNFTVVQPTGSNLHVVVDTAPVTHVIVDSGNLTSNQNVNVAQINGITPLMGNGVTGTGSQRVTIASDNTAFSVNATLSAETTKVIGTVNQGTSPWVVSGSGNFSVVGTKSNNSVAPGSTNLGVLGAVATAAAPSYTEGNQVSLSTDLSGVLRVTSSITGTSDVNISKYGGTSTTLGQKAMASSIPVVLASDQSAIPVTQSGTWTIQQGTPPWTIQGDSASGASKAGNPVQIGGVFNTTQPTVTTGQTVEAQSTARGALIVSTGVDSFNINNISGTISLPTGASTSALQTTTNNSIQALQVTQGSTTSGQSGTLMQGAVTTAAPSYTTGQTDPLSLDTSGFLRATLKSAGTTGAAVPTTANLMGGTDGTNLQAFSVTTAGVLKTIDAQPSTGTTTSVASSASSVTLLAANAARLGGSIYNDSTQILYVKFGSTASTSSYKLQMNPQSFYELPPPVYTGIITGIWASANGNARISEET